MEWMCLKSFRFYNKSIDLLMHEIISKQIIHFSAWRVLLASHKINKQYNGMTLGLVLDSCDMISFRGHDPQNIEDFIDYFQYNLL